MSQDNPYAVSELYSLAESAGDSFDLFDSKQFRVEPPYIVCGKKIQLPEVCVLSGETDDLVPARKSVCLQSWKFEFFRRECKASFFLSRRKRRQLRYAYFGGFLICCAGILLAVVLLQTQFSGIAIPVGIMLFFAGAYVHSRSTVPLVISRRERGQKFWLKGFSPEFLESLQRMEDTSLTHSGTHPPEKSGTEK